MTRFAVFILTIAFVALAGCERQQTTAHTKKTMMTLQQMEEMFANIRAKTKWDVDGEMLWGYFFTDPDTNKLERASETLTARGYRLVQIYPTDDKSTGSPMSANGGNRYLYECARCARLKGAG